MNYTIGAETTATTKTQAISVPVGTKWAADSLYSYKLQIYPNDIKLIFVVQPWDKVDVGTTDTSTGSINMSNVTWMNTKVTVDEAEVNTVFNSSYTVEMYYQPTVNESTYTANNGHFPAQGYFTVNYPSSGKFKIEMIPAYGKTEVDKSAYAIYIYDNTITTGDKWRAIKTDGETITNNTVYFQVRAAKADTNEYNGQIDIWFQPTGSTEWISAYSEIRANYNLHIPSHS